MTTDQMMTAIEAATVRRSEFSILVKEKKKRKEKKKSSGRYGGYATIVGESL